jgi:RNA polymerase sigma-70 factor (ECF subfamily)
MIRRLGQVKAGRASRRRAFRATSHGVTQRPFRTRAQTRATTTRATSPLEALVARREELVRFVRRRVASDADAEEIVQTAFVRGMEHAGELADEEAATAWLYRIVRNAIIDHFRRRDVKGRALEQLAVELPEAIEDTAPDERARVCACVRSLASTLKPEYAELLERVDVEESSIHDVAGALGITANNATVRLHRARKALRDRVRETCRACAEHGCLDCTCKHG